MTSKCTREKAFFQVYQLPVNYVIAESGLLGELIVVVLVKCPRLDVKVSGLVPAVGDIWREKFPAVVRTNIARFYGKLHEQQDAVVMTVFES